MKTRVMLRSVVVLAAALASVRGYSAPLYQVVDLGTLGGAVSYAMGINDVGQVVGWSDAAGNGRHAFVYNNGVMADLGTLGGATSSAYGINNAGQVVGEALNGAGQSRAFLFSDGSMSDLGTFGGSSAFAHSINSNGAVVGGARARNNFMHAYVHDNGGKTDIGRLGTGVYSEAQAISDTGYVVGASHTGTGSTQHAFRYGNGGMTDLGTLGGTHSFAYGVNATGQVVGRAYTTPTVQGEGWSYGGHEHAFLYDGSTMSDLGTLGGANSVAYDINDVGQVVGWSLIVGSVYSHAFIYDAGTVIDLNSLIDPESGWVIQEAHAINNHGDIAAYGSWGGAGPYGHALLLDYAPSGTIPDIIPDMPPGGSNGGSNGGGTAGTSVDPFGSGGNTVPEPATAALAGIALLGWRLAGRRRKCSKAVGDSNVDCLGSSH